MVAKYSREVVDVVRLEEAKKQDEAGRKLIKGSRYLLLKNDSNLGESQRQDLQDLLAANETLNTVYVLKDQFKQIWAIPILLWPHRRWTAGAPWPSRARSLPWQLSLGN